MNIAIDVSPLEGRHSLSHRVRGTGFYLENLIKTLKRDFSNHSYTLFTRGEKLPKDIDLVHIPYFEPFFFTLPIIKKNKTVVTVHDLTPLVFPTHFARGIKGELKWGIQKKLLENTDRIISDSVSSKNDICKFTQLNESDIDVVYLAAGDEFKNTKMNARDIEKIQKKYNLPDAFVLYVGDVTWNKNLPRLLKAMELINIPLVMVGKALVNNTSDNNSWNQDLQIVQEEIKKNKNIKTLGFIPAEDLVSLYNMATVFVMPSLYEGFGLPVLEAMSCGCPVVTTKEGSLQEIAGDACEYVNAYDVTSIAQGIKKVFLDSKLRQKLSIEGEKQAKDFSWKKTAENTLRVYEKALQK